MCESLLKTVVFVPVGFFFRTEMKIGMSGNIVFSLRDAKNTAPGCRISLSWCYGKGTFADGMSETRRA